jgi:hypothetical protein
MGANEFPGSSQFEYGRIRLEVSYITYIDVSFWHLADLNREAVDVGSGVQTGLHNPTDR